MDRITIDMGTSMPERDSTGKKADFGKVILKLLDLNSKAKDPYIDIAELKNDRSSYQQTAGVYDIDISKLSAKVKKLIPDNPFALFVDSYDSEKKSSTSTLALIENPLIANTNSRGLYVNQPDPYWEESTPEVNFTIKVQHYGKAPKKGTVKLAVGQYNPDFTIINEEATTDSNGFSYEMRPFVELSYRGRPISNSSKITVPEDGLVTLSVKAEQPGMPFFVFYPFEKGSKFSGPINFDPNTGPPAPVLFYPYNSIRSLPFDNVLAEEFETWLANLPAANEVHDLIGRVNQRVFDEVYRTFHLMYPVMAFIGCSMLLHHTSK